MSCAACSDFFRREIRQMRMGKGPTNTPCPTDGKCTLTVYSRRKCPRCRMQACTKAGMNSEAIRDWNDRNYYDFNNVKEMLACRICGFKPAKEVYGGVACSSCSDFFRYRVHKERMATHGASSQLIPCPHIPANEGYCQECRYHKCLWTGMKQTLVGYVMNPNEFDYFQKLYEGQGR